MSGSLDGRRVCVCVLGDVGRSPRMQYHSLSLAGNHFAVDLIGFAGSKLHETIDNNKRIESHFMREVPKLVNSFPRLLIYVLKVLWQSTVLFCSLLSLPKPNYVLVQNPPSIPSLAIVWLVCRLRGSLFVIDWHNYGFTILSLTLGDNHFLVKTCKWFESYFGSKSDFNFCVTNAMKTDLKNRFNISATVLYDRAPAIFRPISVEEKHNLLVKLKTEFNEFSANDVNDENETIFTVYDNINSKVNLKPKRPALVMSSTSWTEDEDFNILFEALEVYDKWAKSAHNLPELICVVTGKGPLKEYFRQKISTKEFKRIKIVFPWLSAQDYPKLVASADLGICLHKSSSNLDLPMKVVDMFGCALPVCAYDYDCISELVLHEENGLLFKTSDELATHLKNIFENFPEENLQLTAFRNHLKQTFMKLRWDECWTQNALPAFHK